VAKKIFFGYLSKWLRYPLEKRQLDAAEHLFLCWSKVASGDMEYIMVLQLCRQRGHLPSGDCNQLSWQQCAMLFHVSFARFVSLWPIWFDVTSLRYGIQGGYSRISWRRTISGKPAIEVELPCFFSLKIATPRIRRECQACHMATF
jgi:hypothetical protein